MRTLNAVWRFDCHLYFRRIIALTIAILTYMLVGADMAGARNNPLALWLGTTIFMSAFLVALFLFVGNAFDIGRSATPRESRLFVHVLPVDRSKLAAEKIFFAFVWLEILPIILVSGVVIIDRLFRGLSVHFEFIKTGPALLIWTAFLMWLLLISALLPRRSASIGVPMFLIGEAIARNVYSIPSLVSTIPHSVLSICLSTILLGIQIILFGGVFVSYYKWRKRTWGLLGAIMVLLGIDGVRGIIWWLGNMQG